MTREEAIKIIKGLVGTLEFSASQEDALIVAIEALQGDMYCPNCGVRLVPENEHLEPTHTHGRLIDADALMEYCSNQKTKTISNNDIARFPTAQADRPHGEWYNRDSDGTWATVDFAYCSECKQPIIHKHASPLWHFCPNCGADMRKGKE